MTVIGVDEGWSDVDILCLITKDLLLATEVGCCDVDGGRGGGGGGEGIADLSGAGNTDGKRSVEDFFSRPFSPSTLNGRSSAGTIGVGSGDGGGEGKVGGGGGGGGAGGIWAGVALGGGGGGGCGG